MSPTHKGSDNTEQPAESGPAGAPTPEQLKRQVQLSELQVKLSEAQDKLAALRQPWWKTAGSVTVIAGLLAGVLPVTELIKGWVEASRAKVEETDTRVETARSSYLDRSLNGTNQERLAVLRFIIKTSDDAALRSWAQEEKELVEKQIQDELELAKSQAETEAQTRAAADLVPSLPRLDSAESGGAEAKRAAEEVNKIKERTAALQLKQDKIIANLKLPPSAPVIQRPRARSILWIDPNPSRNVAVREVFETAGVRVVNSPNTRDAARLLSDQRFDVIISAGTREQTEPGYDLLKSARERDPAVPFIIYSGGAGLPDRRAQTARLGASGSTDSPSELVRLVSDSLGLDLRPRRER